MTQERAVLAGGCFWGMQDLIRRHDGVIPTRVGYTGGDDIWLGDLGNQGKIPLADLRAAHEGFFPRLMGNELTPEF